MVVLIRQSITVGKVLETVAMEGAFHLLQVSNVQRYMLSLHNKDLVRIDEFLLVCLTMESL